MSARLVKAQRNRTAERRPMNAAGHRALPKHRAENSLVCVCRGCRCTASVSIPLGAGRYTRRQLTCRPCRGRDHRHHDGSPWSPRRSV